MLADGDLLTVSQGLEILPVGRTLFYQLVEEGQIRSIRCKSVGSRRGRILIVRASIDDYVRRQEAEAPPPRAQARVSVDELLGRTRTPRRTDRAVRSGRHRR